MCKATIHISRIQDRKKQQQPLYLQPLAPYQHQVYSTEYACPLTSVHFDCVYMYYIANQVILQE